MATEKAKFRRETKYVTRYSSDRDSSYLDLKKKLCATVGASGVRTPAYSSMPPPVSTTIRRTTTTMAGSRTPTVFEKRTPGKSIQKFVYISLPIFVTNTDKDSDYISYNHNNSINPRLSSSPTVRTSTSPAVANSNYVYTPDKSSEESSPLRNRYKTLGKVNVSPSLAFSNLINRLNEQYGVKPTLIPSVLLSALIIFFVSVTFMYMTISPDLANTISERNTFYEICGPQMNSAVPVSQLRCIEERHLDGALELLRLMALELQKRIEYHMCKDNTSPFTIGAKEIVRLVQENNPYLNVRKTINDLHNVEYLIEHNPQWKISPVDAYCNALSFDQVLALRDAQSYSFAILNPRLPFTCSLQKFFLYVGGIGLVLLTGGGGGYFIYKLFLTYQ